MRQLHGDGGRIGGGRRGHDGHLPLEDLALRTNPVDVGHDRGGIDGVTGGELRPGLQLEGVGEAVGRGLPGLRQQGLQLALAVDLHQRLVDVVEQRLLDGGTSGRRRVHRLGFGRRTDAQRVGRDGLALGTTAAAGDGEHGNRREGSEAATSDQV